MAISALPARGVAGATAPTAPRWRCAAVTFTKWWESWCRMTERLELVLYHVGGAGGYGVLDQVMVPHPEICTLIVFEARDDAKDREEVAQLRKKGVNAFLVKACVADKMGAARFFVNTYLQSSSMLRPAPAMLNEHVGVYLDTPLIKEWGEVAVCDQEIEVEAITLEAFMAAGGPPPDFISLDAQGMDVKILRGVGPRLDHVLGVCHESAFEPVYEGQETFGAASALLEPLGFRLADLLGPQYWHPGPAFGRGFLTVADPLWLRRVGRIESVMDCIKGAALAFPLGHLSYAYMLMEKALVLDEVETMQVATAYPELLELVDAVERHLPRYRQDNKWLAQHIKLEWVQP